MAHHLSGAPLVSIPSIALFLVVGVEHEQCTQSTHPRTVRGKRWTIRKSCGDKYAIECIFIDATISDGRRLGYAS